MAINLKKDDEKFHKYSAKVNLPGGIKKGDIIIHDKAKKKYYLERNNDIVNYKCAEETAFFKREENPLYKPETLVHFGKQQYLVFAPGSKHSSRTTSMSIDPTMEFKVISSQGKIYTLELLSKPGVRVLADEKLLFTIDYWKFYNTDGQLQRLMLGTHPKKEQFCKSIGNYFETDEAAKVWLTKMQTTKKIKYENR